MSRQPDIRYKELFRDLAVTPDKEAFLKKRVKSVLRERHGNPVCQTRRFPVFIRAACAAAVIIIFAVVSCLLLQRSRELPLTAMSEQCLENGARLFDELDSVFDRRLDWVYETDGKIQMGVNPELTTYSSLSEQPMLVRLAVLRRLDDGGWDHCFKADIMMRGEQFAEIVPDGYPETRLHLWLAPASEGRVAIDTAFFMENDEKLVSQIKGVVHEGKLLEMHPVVNDDSNYRVFQIIQRLDNPVG